MANNRIVLNDEVLMDLTSDTVTSSTLLQGTTAHSAAGDAITGTLLPVLSVNNKLPNSEGAVTLELQDLGGDLADYVTKVDAPGYNDILTQITATATYVPKVAGSRLMTDVEGTKLSTIASGAEVNVQSDWNETNTESDAYIQNKPNLNYLPIIGGELTGPLSLTSNRLTALANGTDANDAVNLSQLTSVSDSKQNRLSGDPGKIVAFNATRAPEAVAPSTIAVTGVKGSNQASYQLGQVTLSASDVGALSADGKAVDSELLDGHDSTYFVVAKTLTPVPNLSLVTYDTNGIISTSEEVTEITDAQIDTIWLGA